jgi:hypothetical protein
MEPVRDDGLLECTLLNEPEYCPRYRIGDRVLVGYDHEHLRCPVCVGPVS